ncbi:MAG: hypothetical protein ACRD4R_03010 [Candidatus Acidiferrales bacterium]
MMDCSQFRELLADLDRPGVLPAEVRERAFAHAEVCGDCGQLLTETELLDAELRRLIAKDGDARPSGRAEARLLDAFRERKARAARENVRRFAAVAGIAAMVLLSLGFWLYQRTERTNGSSKMTMALQTVPVQSRTDARSPKTQQVAHRGIARVAEARGGKLAPEGSASDDSTQVASEDASAFIPLPDAGDPALLDDGAVVRVVMPRADLASFGLPVEAMEGDGTVKADLIVSADGTPQAIRLVSQDEASGQTQ